ncbi:tail-anchored protein insertion receptor WRB-like isoform X1 [Pocillopora damicornis]|uniref:tail-anchored protein insertion receptor WRB-like isoform X1 n=1 Tax=Pocillopora damicornis TaxID=46731 RepID=UPI000F5573C8|nr:tail-anchored protein insertion receptor WRB-like isoform X1 [Pocillopora damicornis]
MAVSMVVFVLAYVFVMRILYKSSGFLADWLPRLLMSKEQNGSHLKDTIIQLKDEQMKISAQDEFARYMRLERKIKKLNEELSQIVKQRSEKITVRSKILTAIFMGLLIHHSVTLIHLKGSLSYGICVCVQKGASGVVTCAMVLSTQQNFSLPYWNTWGCWTSMLDCYIK